MPAPQQSDLILLQNEQFSDLTVTTSDHLTMVGQIVSKSYESHRLSMSIFTEPANVGIARWEVLLEDPPAEIFEIGPGRYVDYSITIRPLDPGLFHLHMQLNIIDQNSAILSRGQTVNVTDNATNAHDLKLNSFPVKAIGDNIVEMKIHSSSNISDISVNSDMNQILLKASGPNGTRGTTIIPVSKVLTGPYSVFIDGHLSGNAQTILTSQSGEISLTLAYFHGTNPSDIIIQGTRVLPEFGSSIIVGIAAVSIIGIMVTTRFVPRTK